VAADATVTVVVPVVGLAMEPNSRSRVAVTWFGATMVALAFALAETGAAWTAAAAAAAQVAAANPRRSFILDPLVTSLDTPATCS
jgi:hypothetical protein